METRNKSIFWEALILAIFVFASGVFLGYLMEKNRVSQVVSLYQQSELDLLDIKIQNELFSLKSLQCNSAQAELLAFADRIYEEAKLLERYEGSNKITQEIKLQHKKYDLLRAMLFINTLQIKERCNNTLDTILYVYNYDTEDIGLYSQQTTFSKKLEQVKSSKGGSLILIPLAGNINSTSISYILKQYNITILPTILVNEDLKIASIGDLEKLDNLI